VDLPHLMRVAWRWKCVTAVGFLAAFALTFLAVMKVDPSHGFKLSYRQGQQFEADSTLFVTQSGFPWGRTVPEYVPGNSAAAEPSLPVSDADRLASLTALYAQLANGDAIRRKLPEVDDITNKLSVTPVSAPPYVNPAILPLLTVAATTPAPETSIALAKKAANLLQNWLAAQQRAAGIPDDERVELQLVARPIKAKLTGHRSKTLPAAIFLGLLLATFGIVFTLENLNPRAEPVAEDEDGEAEAVERPARLAS
jgi:hypothetical protein